jgi:type IV fimbrial biogenesis protein FimT
MTATPASTPRPFVDAPPRGRSLVELMSATAIVAVLLGSAVPALRDLIDSQALQATAALLETDIHYARTTASSSRQQVRLSLQALPDTGTCYVIHTGPAHACRCAGGGQAVCDGGARLIRLEEQRQASGITLAPVARSMLFDPGEGTVTPTATIRLLDREGRELRQVVNIMGRVRSCVAAGRVGGIRACG